MANILADNFTSTIRPATLGVPVLGKQPYLERMKLAGISFGVSMLSFSPGRSDDETILLAREAKT
jgi:hypothetical protein